MLLLRLFNSFTTALVVHYCSAIYKDVKNNAVGRKRAQNLQELKNNVTQYLFETQKCPELVRSYFQKDEVAYAG